MQVSWPCRKELERQKASQVSLDSADRAATAAQIGRGDMRASARAASAQRESEREAEERARSRQVHRTANYISGHARSESCSVIGQVKRLEGGQQNEKEEEPTQCVHAKLAF